MRIFIHLDAGSANDSSEAWNTTCQFYASMRFRFPNRNRESAEHCVMPESWRPMDGRF